MNPNGRQFASGLSCEFDDIRCLRSAMAHGVNGSPSLICAPTLANVATGGPSPMFGSGGAPNRPLGGMRLSHRPEKSGLPFDSLGGGAFMSGLPSAARGTSGRTKFGHCADNATVSVSISPRVNESLIVHPR